MTMIVTNLTTTPATQSQKDAGVVDLPTDQQEKLKQLLDTGGLIKDADYTKRILDIVQIAKEAGNKYVLMGHPPMLLRDIENCLRVLGMIPFYSICSYTREEGSKHVHFAERN